MIPNQVARIAALVGDPARAGMLLALMSGRALTAKELAAVAHITPATGSRHLSLLVDAGLLRVSQQGRHRYHQLASADVARLLEGIMQLAVAGSTASAPATGPRDPRMRFARTCYDHLAGRLAVAVADRLVEERAVVIDEETAVLTDRAPAVLASLGVDGFAPAQGNGKRPACRPCLDWGERRMHLAGRLGALLCSHCLQQGWLLPMANTRTLELTPRGATALRDWLGVRRWQELAQPEAARS
jgi:DNA-binding transcriptional ArsR family regulator